MNIEKIIPTDFRGCVSIYQKEETLFQKAYGYADLSNKVLNDIETRFATASAGKIFVAVGILQLVEKGKLHLEDKIGTLFDFDWEQIDSEITVEQLLTHTSGIPDYFDESVMTEYEDLWYDFPNYRIRSNKDLLPLFIHKEMTYPKGSKFQYNNTGMARHHCRNDGGRRHRDHVWHRPRQKNPRADHEMVRRALIHRLWNLWNIRICACRFLEHASRHR